MSPDVGSDAGVHHSADPGVHIGHVHLKVADLERALAFYSGVLGLKVIQRLGDAAVFLSAGGYHHHIAINTWESLGGSPPPPGSTGLYHTAIVYPTRASLADALHEYYGREYRLRGRRITGSANRFICATRMTMESSCIATSRGTSGRGPRTASWRCSPGLSI